MGMFDDITVKVPLPGTTETEFQTKSLINALDRYEIREDGSLWHEEYDLEDCSDSSLPGLQGFRGVLTRVNQWWHRDVGFTGEIKFHRWDKEAQVMYEYVTFFVRGEMRVPPIRLEDER